MPKDGANGSLSAQRKAVTQTVCWSGAGMTFHARAAAGGNVQSPSIEHGRLADQPHRPTQPSIPPWSVNEYQPYLGRQRQVWLIPIADERVGAQVKL